MIRHLSIAGLAVAVVLIAPAYAYGQVVTAPPSIPTSVATKTEVQAAQTAADNAATAAAAAQAAIPVPATTIPTMEAIGGAAGSTNTFRRGDAVQPRISRTVSGVTLATGLGAVAWATMQSVPKLTVTPYVTSTETQVPTCYPVIGTVTTTGATIKCFKTQTLLGLGLIPFTVAPAGVQFDVLALPGS
jgi:hypothetical protein